MITQDNLFLKRFSQLTVLAMVTIGMVALSEKKTLAIPVKPVLNQMGHQIVEGVFNVDSTAQATPPATQPSPNVQQKTVSSPESPPDPNGSLAPTYPPTDPAYPPSSSPVPPNYPSTTYPQGYPAAYPPSSSPVPPNYPSAAYPQAYPAYPPYSVPTPPAYSAPTYPQGYPVYPPGRANPPVIINNF